MSAPAGKAQRSRRGRVLIVGRLPGQHGHAEFVGLFAQPPMLLANMFEALGEVTASGSQDPVAAVIVADEFTRGPHQCAIQSLRRLDPSVRIIGVMGNGEAPASGNGGAGPDAWLGEAIRAEDLRRALDDDGLLASATKAMPHAPASPPATQSPAPPSTAPAVIDLDAEVPSAPRKDNAPGSIAASPVEESAAPEASGLDSMRAAPSVRTPPRIDGAADTATSTPTPTPTPTRPEPVTTATGSAALPAPLSAIGDTDLLHAMLHDPDGVLSLALRLIGHHGRWSNVRIAAVDSQISEGVEILACGQRFGRLLADDAPPGQLRLWADWLGHWLHMQHEHARLRELCITDDLTGARNRRFFHAFLDDAIARARVERRPLTVMVFDIDNFKPYNDRYGHQAGDEILCEIVRLLKSIVRQGDVVCRIGGDEFVVVFADPEAPRTPGSKHPETIEVIARRIHQAVNSMRFPKLGVDAPGTLSISAGLATYPWDGQDSTALLHHADERALESKRRGKNAITLGPSALTSSGA